MTLITDELAALLSTVNTPGDFYAAGTSLLHLPRLEVEGVGRVALPLLPAQARPLIAAAERAPYGRGEETLVDTAVRRTWQIGAERLRIEGQHWVRGLEAILTRAAAGLGVTCPVVPELYKLLVYDEGSFFVSHRDTEKSPGMFATLIVALPSVHAGGEVLVRHQGREVRLDLHCPDPSELAYAAFYADCVHEVLPVTAGCRLALVYNLLRGGPAGPLPRPPSYDKEQTRLTALMQRWSASKDEPGDAMPEKLVYLLQHAYTPAELGFEALKGPDAAAAGVLAVAAQQAECDLHVALLTIEECGTAEYLGYSRSRRRGGGGEGSEDFEVVEVSDRAATLAHWVRPDRHPAGWGSIPLEEREICPTSALDDLSPDEQHFQEATGNEGASFDRTYRRAALVLWPRHRRLAVLNQAGLPATLPRLNQLARQWAEGGADRTSPLWREAHELAGHMVRTWPKQSYPRFDLEPGMETDMLGSLARLGDVAHIEAFVAEISAAGQHGAGDNAALLDALRLLPPALAGELIERVVAALMPVCPATCGDLLARAAAASTCALAGAARVVVEALPGDPAGVPPSSRFDWGKPEVEAGLVVDLMTALPHIDARLADRAVSHLLAWPGAYDPDTVVLPAVRRLAASAADRGRAAVERLTAACVDRLRARVALPLAPPADWTRAAALDCRCSRCAELARFLASADERAWALKAAVHERAHVMKSIRQGSCDVDCETLRRGSPHSLVCTKNQASYQRRVVQRQQDLEDLGLLA